MKIKVISIAFITTSLFIISPIIIFAASNTYLQKATQYYNQNCNNKNFSKSEAFDCYIFDKIKELEILINNQNSKIIKVESVNNAQDAQIDILNKNFETVSANISGLSNKTSALNNRIDSLDETNNTSIRALSSRISGLDNRISTLENVDEAGNFNLSVEDQSYPNGYGAWVVKLKINAAWKGISITDDLQTHGILHSGGSEYPFIQKGVYISPQVLIPPSTQTATVDIYVFWQGIKQHITATAKSPM